MTDARAIVAAPGPLYGAGAGPARIETPFARLGMVIVALSAAESNRRVALDCQASCSAARRRWQAAYRILRPDHTTRPTIAISPGAQSGQLA